MIARLGELLRLATDTAQAQEVPLRQELEFLQRYLDIQHVRFHDRLRVRIEIGDETLGAKVPSLMLQPLVENAIRHGISPRASGGTVTVTARQVGNELRMEIEDDGMGLHPTAREGGSGVGLANTRARLEQLYGDDHRFAVESRTDGGTRVSLVMPFVQT